MYDRALAKKSTVLEVVCSCQYYNQKQANHTQQNRLDINKLYLV